MSKAPYSLCRLRRFKIVIFTLHYICTCTLCCILQFNAYTLFIRGLAPVSAKDYKQLC